MTDMIIKIMVRLLEVLALATKQIKHGRFSKCLITYTLTMSQGAVVKFAKKLLGESEIEAVLQRLDGLTHEEARMAVAQTLGVVHSLVNNVRIVMEGAECLLNLLRNLLSAFLSDGKASTDSIRQELGK